MNRSPFWRTMLDLVIEDKEFFFGFVSGIVVLLSEIVAPEAWRLGLRTGALLMLAIGFSFYLYRHYHATQVIRGRKPTPIIMGTGHPRPQAARDLAMIQESITRLTGFKDFSRVERYFNVHYEDLLAHRAELLPPVPEAWQNFLEDAQQDVRQFLQHVPGERVYHIAVHGPSSLALGLGAIVGTRTPLVGYHFSGGRYLPVLDLRQDPRLVKTTHADQAVRFVNVTYPDALSEDTAIVLDLAGHIASGDVKDYLARQMPSVALVEVSNTYGGNLTTNDWVPVVQELFAVFNVLQRDGAVRRIHLFHSMPVPLALGLGMALGTFVPLTVYNWEQDKGSYYPVLQLNQLRSLL